MTTAIVMTLYRRLEYTVQVLLSLRACFSESGPLPTYLFVDCGPDAVARGAHQFAEDVGPVVRVVASNARLGCNANTFRALRAAFAEYDSVIALEDDTVLAPDALRYFLWGLGKYRNDRSVFSISGYHRTSYFNTEHTHAVQRRKWFTPWGWATWADRFADIEKSLSSRSVPKGQSWDVYVTQNARRERYEVYPVLGRVQNIGATDGENVPSSDWHRRNHHCPLFAGQFSLSSDCAWAEL